jgi:hypothetical protein
MLSGKVDECTNQKSVPQLKASDTRSIRPRTQLQPHTAAGTDYSDHSATVNAGRRNADAGEEDVLVRVRASEPDIEMKAYIYVCLCACVCVCVYMHICT